MPLQKFNRPPKNASQDSMMEDKSAFFYGTLMEESVFYSVVGGNRVPDSYRRATVRMRPAVLHHYARRRVEGAPFPAIHAEPNSKVRGIYVTGLTESDMRALDVFEGEFMYDRVAVNVKLLKGDREAGEAQTETYVWRDGSDGLENREWDFTEFRKTKLASFIGDDASSGAMPDDGFEDAERCRRRNCHQRSASNPRNMSRGRQGRRTGIQSFPRAQSLQVCSSSSPSRSGISNSTSLSGRKRSNASQDNIVGRSGSVSSRFHPERPGRLRSRPSASGLKRTQDLEATTAALSKYSVA